MKLGNFARRETLLFSAGAIAHPLLSGCVSLPQPVRRMGGANLVETLEAPFGSASAAESLRKLAAIGASLVAIIPFLWQSGSTSPDISLGDALPYDRLRAGIRQAREVGLIVIVKPHVWVPQSWAGKVEMQTEADWASWFANYRREMTTLASIAESERAADLIVGTELRGTSHRTEWRTIIDDVRTRFSGRLSYTAHGIQEAERIAFWPQLDAVGLSLYPVLGADDDTAGRHDVMRRNLERGRAIAKAHGRAYWILEIGLRSAVGAAAMPWESAEERVADANEALQASVIAMWLDEIERTGADMVLIWRWLTDSTAGGTNDTDFTVQNKLAEDVIRRRWLRN